MYSLSKRSILALVSGLWAVVAFSTVPGISYVTPALKTKPLEYLKDKPLPAGLHFNSHTGKTTNAVPAKAFKPNSISAPAVVVKPDIRYATPNTYFKNVPISALVPTNMGGAVPATIYSETKVIAGTGVLGSVNGDAATAQFMLPYGISIDTDGNMYIAESGGGVRMISASGQVSSLGTDALPGAPFNVPKFNNPRGVVKDKNGNLFVANYSNHNILKITPLGVVTVFAGINQSGTADGPGNVANIINPAGIAIDKDDNLYVTDGKNAIRKISPSGYVYTIAGQPSAGTVDGLGRAAKFKNPIGIAVDKDGYIYVADRGGFAIRKISPLGMVTTIAGGGFGTADGIGTAASFQSPVGITVDASGNLYVTDSGAGTVRRIAPDGEVKTIAGGGPIGTESGVGNHVHFSSPSGLTIGPDGNLYVAEYGKNSIKQVIATGYTIDKDLPAGLVFDPRTGIITGTPTVLWPATDYTITAYNAGGSSKFVVRIEVIDQGLSTINVGNISGTISTCAGSPSTSTQQFTVSGNDLTDNITISAPNGFEISTNPAGGFANTLFLVTQGSTVTQRVVYVRAAALATPANLSGTITLNSAGALTKTVTVTAIVYANPSVNNIADLAFNNGDIAATVHFTGTATTYTWTNDNPSIGLPANGIGDIPSFAAVNNLTAPAVANITVVPSNSSCGGGNPITFKITVDPTTLTASLVSGNIIACQSSPSASPDIQQFSVTGSGLTSNVQIAAPGNFEVSLSANTGYSNALTIVPIAGKINGAIVYVRSSAGALAGNISGTVTISSAGVPNQTANVSGTINALPTVNPVSSLGFDNGATTTAIHFTGTATTYTWTNDNPSIGLSANGSGDIPSFTTINNLTVPVVANITVSPSNTSCTGSPVTFEITVNPIILAASSVTGNIIACQGSSSASPDIQQFSVTGNGLTGDVQIMAPANFEISLNANTGYSNTLTIAPITGKVGNTAIYVRSSASAPVGNISGIVTISSAGALNQTVNVSGIVNALPVVDPVLPLVFNNGAATTAIHFAGTATTYSWTNDNPSIGLPANGSGDIPSFAAVNNLTAPVVANITVVPSNPSCGGNPVTFKITVDPTTLTASLVSGNIIACQGSPAASPDIQQFSVSGNGLTNNVQIAAPANFEVSASPNAGYANTLTVVPVAGNVGSTVIYVRSSPGALVGNISGIITISSAGAPNQTVNVSGIVNALPTVNPVSSLAFNNGAATTAIHFTGMATNYTWTNDNPSIGLPANGNGDIPSFTAVNKGRTLATATITVVPSNASCTGSSVTFKITVAAPPTGVVIVNAFTPNGDGINDTWMIKYIEYYPNCTVDIFNRRGARMFSSIGYGQQWNGQSNGMPVPADTYYYVINLRDESPVKSGWVSVIR